MTAKEIADLAKGNWQWLFIAGLSIVEVSKIKINPWTALFEWIGNILMAGVKNDIKHLNAEMETVKRELDTMKQDSKEDAVKIARIRILRCADEVYRGDRHSKEYFDNALDDITTYTEYCRSHPNFKNEKTVIAIRRIEEIYERCLKDHSFL